MERFISLLGIPILLAICYALSNNRKKINWAMVGWGLGMQFLFALLMIRTDIGAQVFGAVKDVVTALLGFTAEGSKFVFGNLATGNNVPVGKGAHPFAPLDLTGPAQGLWANHGAFFAFGVLPTIVFFSSLMTVLYHLGIMQRVVYGIAFVMQKFMKTSGSETLCAAANIFIGQTEAPLTIKPYLPRLTESELLSVMVAGMGTIAGGVMAVYGGFLQGGLPSAPGHLLAASVMSAIGSLVIAKMLVPETAESETAGHVPLEIEKTDKNVIDAAARGASEGMGLAINVAAMLIAFIAMIALFNSLWGGACHGVERVFQLKAGTFGAVDTLQKLLGYANAPFAFIMGIPTQDLVVAGGLLGEHTIINEFFAFLHMGDILNGKEIGPGGTPVVLQQRSAILLTYAMCSFANLGSIGIQIGGIGGLAQNRRGDLAKLGILALIGGTITTYISACIAGVLI